MDCCYRSSNVQNNNNRLLVCRLAATSLLPRNCLPQQLFGSSHGCFVEIGHVLHDEGVICSFGKGGKAVVDITVMALICQHALQCIDPLLSTLLQIPVTHRDINH